MIRELRLRGLGVINEACVPFAPGLTVLTGETGAGKTMVLTGLGLVMGAKGDAGVVRTGQVRADVDAEFVVDDEIFRLAHELGADMDNDVDGQVLLLGRSIAAEGRSRAFVGGRSVPAASLADIAERLIAVHGQSDQILLRDARRQRELLDRYAGPEHAISLATYRDSYQRWRTLDRELAETLKRRDELTREIALLRHGIADIAAVAPVDDEDVLLKEQATVLANATELLIDVMAAHDLLVGGEDSDTASALTILGQAQRLLDRAAIVDPRLNEHRDSLVVAADALSALAMELGGHSRNLEADPARLAAIEDRRQAISSLKRAYGPTLADVLQWWQDAQHRVESADPDRLDALQAEVAALRAGVEAQAAAITSSRQVAAAAFARAVAEELHALAMADADLRIDVAAGEPGPDGADAITFLLRPHAGSDFRPLGRGASGGELSRIMLAVEVVLADGHGVPTFVFDEVDSGVGGKVAVEVGRRLARLSRQAQVIVVTHLPQVAAFADQHVVVTKGTGGAITATSVQVVEGEDRVSELVRMLSGLEGSQSGATHAAELLALARQER
jgi:DNA repair protein RecN (Recombination protein N)